MARTMQTILGAGGTIGYYTSLELTKYTDNIRQVSRSPKKVNTNDELFPADLTDPKQTSDAIKGSEIVYLTAGLKYDKTVWVETWPKIMDNVINACKVHNAKLVFFDNVYLYGKVDGTMTEKTPVNPCSIKGEVRALIAEKLEDEYKKGNIQGLIARAADFYGPKTPLGIVNLLVFENLANGKKAQWMGNAAAKHTFTYTPDAGKATALLGNTESAYNQVWHLPADKNTLTGKQFIEESAKYFSAEPKFMELGRFMLNLAGLFNKTIKETVEMLYQFENDYIFDSTKFDNAFDFEKIDHIEGITRTAEYYKIGK